ncbi:DUF305 domain-containing protein [Streptomyces sp. 8L]|uniref:DUF305 domain-containing protein n=1 Tax=Streptomyces sp. 8L TaxID=2877242 RepID=UPI001CD7A92C|nr:DUF305 domain-containing protein [Streptomyces sp. 8L]MCA1219070.1 DUF305 domain-containing protein [Streptomyces sp. 8L]
MTTPPRPLRAAAATAGLARAARVLTACSSAGDGTPGTAPQGGAPSASVSPGAHNAQDAAFARAMIPHHRQAVAMAALAPQRAGSAAVRTLAARIGRAQSPEITVMTGWLAAWGVSAPSAGTPSAGSGEHTGMPGMSGMGSSVTASARPAPHGSGASAAMPGMMSDADLATLRGLKGAAFDTAFLRMMIGHHQGAVTMARAERSGGVYRPAKALAASIATSQTAEIRQMRTLLGAP